MTKLVPERVFDISKPLVTRRPFSAAGRNYAPGDPVDIKKLVTTPRRISQMFDAGLLEHPRTPEDEKAEADRLAAEAEAEQAAAAMKIAEEFAAEQAEEEAQQEQVEQKPAAKGEGK